MQINDDKDVSGKGVRAGKRILKKADRFMLVKILTIYVMIKSFFLINLRSCVTRISRTILLCLLKPFFSFIKQKYIYIIVKRQTVSAPLTDVKRKFKK